MQCNVRDRKPAPVATKLVPFVIELRLQPLVRCLAADKQHASPSYCRALLQGCDHYAKDCHL